MSKLSLDDFMFAANQILQDDISDHHRRILNVYRQHAMLEIAGRWKEIFDPRLTVDSPEYVFAAPENYFELSGSDSVKWFYNSISVSGTSVRLIDNEDIVISDKGFMSEALYHIYLNGETARRWGHDVDSADGLYVESRWSCVYWKFNEEARMIGERIYPASTAKIAICEPDNFWTTANVSKILNPVIEKNWILLT